MSVSNALLCSVLQCDAVHILYFNFQVKLDSIIQAANAGAGAVT